MIEENKKTDIFNDFYQKPEEDVFLQNKKFENNYLKGSLKSQLTFKGVNLVLIKVVKENLVKPNIRLHQTIEKVIPQLHKLRRKPSYERFYNEKE